MNDQTNKIDVSIGEPYVIREILFKHFNLANYFLPQPDHCWEYPSPQGYLPLVKVLEEQYGYPVVITAGAKQGIGACAYALKQMGKRTIGLLEPHWKPSSSLIEMHGLKCIFGKHPSLTNSYFIIAPSNPDNYLVDLKCLESTCQSKNIPLIHDAAYYSHIYLSPNVPLKVYGDVQIHSISKQFGLSGLRIGYCVCKNPDFYSLILEYMEAMTVGVSITSQLFLLDLLTQMEQHPLTLYKFEEEAAAALSYARQVVSQVNPDILQIPKYFNEENGLFLWAQKGSKFNQEKLQVQFADGEPFGNKDYVRMNLAFNAEKINEIVSRLNAKE